MRTAAWMCAFRPASRALGASVAASLVIAAAGALGGAGCTASSEDVRPPPDQLSFPTGMAVSPDEKFLFVTNANSELRYDSGSIGVIDLAVVQDVIAQWTSSATVPTGCAPDPDHAETLACDEAQFFKRDAGVRVGNFATDLAVQDFSTGGATNLRVFVPTRGDPSVAWADFDGDRLHCTSAKDVYALCDDAHRLTSLDNNPDLDALANEPYSVFTDAAHGFTIVTHLNSGSVTLINAPTDSSQVQIVDAIHGVFAPSVMNGVAVQAASTAAGRTPGGPDDVVYVASSSENRVQTFTVAKLDNAAAYLLPGPFFLLDAVGVSAGDSGDTRGIRFSSDGNRLYVVNRSPPSVQVYDTALDATGVSRNALVGASDICREASSVAVLPGGGPTPGDRVYVTCFQDGQVYVVDPTGSSHVDDIISVGRGPFAAVPVTGKNTAGRPQLFVSNFLEDTIAVIDLSMDSPKQNRVVLRIGTPRTR